ncbi:MAG: hypothetical protein Q9166_003481 [cf. Caloplaca sp. 2 TL-2023]
MASLQPSSSPTIVPKVPSREQQEFAERWKEATSPKSIFILAVSIGGGSLLCLAIAITVKVYFRNRRAREDELAQGGKAEEQAGGNRRRQQNGGRWAVNERTLPHIGLECSTSNFQLQALTHYFFTIHDTPLPISPSTLASLALTAIRKMAPFLHLVARSLLSGDPSTPRSKSIPAAVGLGVGLAVPVGIVMIIGLYICARRHRRLVDEEQRRERLDAKKERRSGHTDMGGVRGDGAAAI